MYETTFPSLLVTFREALEAALIVTIIVIYLRKTGRTRHAKYAYAGVGAALILSISTGYLIQAIYGVLPETSAQIFEGIASLTAVAVLTYMIMWMTGHSRGIKVRLQTKIDVSLSRGELYGIASLAFIAVFREGLETVLFLSTMLVQDLAGGLVGIIVGFVLVLVISILFIRGTVELEIGLFFKVTSVLLVVFAAGLAGYGVHELLEAGEGVGLGFGWLAQKPFNINPPVNFDGSYPLFHEKGVIGSVLKALVGYDGDPEWLRIIVYLSYWVVISYYLVRKSS